MKYGLKGLAEQIRSIQPSGSLSDDAVEALSAMNLALLNTVVAHDADGEYGSRDSYTRTADALFALCGRRTGAGQPLARRVRMIPVMYELMQRPGAMFDRRQFDSCVSRSERAVNDWVKALDEGSLPAELRVQVECGALRCTAEMSAFVAEADRQSDEDVLRMMRRLDEWVSEMGTNGRWAGLSEYEILCRLDVLNSCSMLHGVTAYDALVGEWVEGCFERMIHNAEHCDAHALYMLYKVLTRSMMPHSAGLSASIADYSSCMADRYSAGSEDWLWCMSVVLDRECMRLNEEIQNRIFAHSA